MVYNFKLTTTYCRVYQDRIFLYFSENTKKILYLVNLVWEKAVWWVNRTQIPEGFGQDLPLSHSFPARANMSYLRDVRGNEARCQISIGLRHGAITHGNWRAAVARQTY